MLSWDIETVVPGHGPITDRHGIREFRDYLAYIIAQARHCYDQGMSFEEAADRMSLDRWAHLAEAERLYINIYACYREFSGGSMPKPNFMAMYDLMAKRHFRDHSASCQSAGCMHPHHAGQSG